MTCRNSRSACHQRAVYWTLTRPGSRSDKDDGLRMSYRFLGGQVGEPLDLSGLKVARHTRGDARGVKHEKPNYRVVPVRRFRQVPDIRSLFDLLFGV